MAMAASGTAMPVLQTYTDESSTKIVVLAPSRIQNSRFRILHGKTRITHFGIAGYASPYSGTHVYHLDIEGLQPAKSYTLEILSADLRRVLDRRSFGALEVRAPRTRITLASCMYDKLYKPQVWAALERTPHDAVFFIGDNVYANKPQKIADPAQLWMRHTQTRSTISFFYQRRLIPVFSTWDDHDFGVNNGGLGYPYTRESQRIFRIFFGSPSDRQASFSKGPGISFSWKNPQGLWVFFDNRSFRAAGGSAENGPYLGRAQLKWFKEQMTANASQPLFLIGGSKFFEHELPEQEGYEQDHPREFGEFLSLLKGHDAKAIFISGDRHYSEISEVPQGYLGYKTHEITASAMHSYTFPMMLAANKNKYRLMGTAKENFVVLDLQRRGPRLKIRTASFGEKQRSYFDWQGRL